VIGRGQQVKVFNNLFREAYAQGYVLNRPSSPWPLDEIEYQGAKVLDPLSSLYLFPVGTMDFAQLYPSIMLAYNLCPSTLVLTSSEAEALETRERMLRAIDPDKPPARLAAIAEVSRRPGLLVTDARLHHGDSFSDPAEAHTLHSVTKDPMTNLVRRRTQRFHFVQHEESLTAIILNKLTKARKAAKNVMESLPDTDIRYTVAERRQLALKLLANSKYGFYGIQDPNVALYGCMMVSVSVTLVGRAMITGSRDFVHRVFGDVQQARRLTNAFFEQRNEPTRVREDVESTERLVTVYGDTDSIFIYYPTFTMEESYALSMAIQVALNQLYRRPMRIEFEKVYYPMLLIGKKRYAAVKIAPDLEGRPGKPKQDAKGLDLVRRDRSKLLRDTEERLLKMLLSADLSRVVDKPSADAWVDRQMRVVYEYVVSSIERLVRNEYPVDMFVKSKARKASYKRGDQSQPHMTVVNKNKARGSMRQYGVGDRVDFLQCLDERGKSNSKGIKRSTNLLCEKGRDGAALSAEDPDFALENAVPIDRIYYLDHDLTNALTTITTPLRTIGLPSLTPVFEWARRCMSIQMAGSQTLLKRHWNQGTAATATNAPATTGATDTPATTGATDTPATTGATDTPAMTEAPNATEAPAGPAQDRGRTIGPGFAPMNPPPTFEAALRYQDTAAPTKFARITMSSTNTSGTDGAAPAQPQANSGSTARRNTIGSFFVRVPLHAEGNTTSASSAAAAAAREPVASDPQPSFAEP
jgi:DNA polymerase delta subunit 1